MPEKRVVSREQKRSSSIGRHPVPSANLVSNRLVSVAELEQMRCAGGESSMSRNWRWTAYDQIKKHATHVDFPCFFAAKAFDSGAPIFLFVESSKLPESRSAIAAGLEEYLQIVTKRSGWGAAATVFFIVLKPQSPVRSLETYHSQAWDVLSYLHHHDPREWPKEIPTDMDNPDWSFYFNGVPMFVNMSCPAHYARPSRNLGNSLALVMQPRAAFDEIAGNTPAGLQVRKRIRARIQKYDLIGPSPALGAYGDKKNREWAQYGLTENNDEVPGTCPYKKSFQKK